MSRKCYISFKAEEMSYKTAIEEMDNLDVIHKSLTEPIKSDDEDYIMQVIRRDYLSDSTVTIHLIGEYGAENRGWEEQKFIKREMQASLYNRAGNSKSGILGIVLPKAEASVFKGKITCSTCGESHNLVNINDNTTIKEFSYNYYIPNSKCAWSDEDHYCVLTTWDKFVADPNPFIEEAFAKRSAPIASKTKVRP